MANHMEKNRGVSNGVRQSQLFTKTRREAPADEVAKNAQLLIRAGFVNKEMAGAYAFLPLGLRTLEKINAVIRDEMNKAGGQELHMTALQSRELWEKTDRWSDDVVDNWFKTNVNAGGEVGLGFTHEEPVTEMMKAHVRSYADLPVLVYQIQLKFRNEERAKSGLMRGREFYMKDLYSFAASEEEHKEIYERLAEAYMNVFSRVGLGDRTFKTFASGGSFSKYSHEFQTLSPVGEDTIHVARGKGIAINKEVLTPEVLADLGVAESELTEERAVEVGNIFSLGTRFSEALGLSFADKEGAAVHPIMGCYGIGPSRLLGVIVETFADEKGIVWPREVAPFSVHLIELSGGDANVKEKADALYRELTDIGVEVLYDERDLRAGEKFADSDLIGLPLRIVVGKKTIETGQYECVRRLTGLSYLLPDAAAIAKEASHD